LYEAKSGGIAQTAVVHVTQEMIDWADVVFVMSEKEDGHQTYIENNFNLKDKLIWDLDVSDNYDRDDPELIELLREKLQAFMALRGYPAETESRS
jgi:predicted protein tyrosine phosphatase